MFICNGSKSNRQISINTDSNKISSTNDNKTTSESDLIIIDYPYEKSKIDNKKNNEFEKVENKKIEKIEIDKINLTLSNPSISDSDEIIDENEVFFVENEKNEKNIYKNSKKLINSNNNLQTVKSISFNINKKQKNKTRNKKNEIIPFKSNEFQINSINYNSIGKINENLNVNNLIIKNFNFSIENNKKIYQKKKIFKIETNNSINLAKINQNVLINNYSNNEFNQKFQTFDQTNNNIFKNQNNNNFLLNSSINFNNKNDSSFNTNIFYSNSISKISPFFTSNSISNFKNNIKTFESIKIEYCPKCEEIYKYLIYNNMPLKIITCLYCNKTLNEKVYEYFKNLYLNNNLFTENNEIQYSITNKTNNSRNIKKNNNENDILINKNNTYSSFNKYKKDELLNFSSSFEQRKNNKSKIIYYSSKNIEMNNIYKRFQKNEKIENKKLNKKKYNSSKNLIKEPSKKLLKRLINGEKIKTTKKEIKEVNERLYKKLNEVKKVEKEKKEEFKKLNLVKKSYTTNLKNQVIQKYKENFNKNILNNVNNSNENNIIYNEQNNNDSVKLKNINNHKK